ncbi:hypothetical protein [Streptomyces sp. NPDC090022]|uniref:hypothetical protein n=1 Tax=Streptomyces sp. NPDC090022 TaxID=3365920 RepID=UPI0038098621
MSGEDQSPAPAGGAGAAAGAGPGAGAGPAGAGVGAGAGAGAAGEPAARPEGERADAETPPEDEPGQDAWLLRQDLNNHSPRVMRMAGGVSGGILGVNQGTVGAIHVSNYHLGSGTGAQVTGEIPEETLRRLAAGFVTAGTPFEALLERLRNEHVLVLTGVPSTGRRTAALTLLHRLGAAPVHALDRGTSPAELVERVGATSDGRPAGVRGHVVCDLITRRDRPLRDVDVLALRARLGEDGYLVVTVGPGAHLDDVPTQAWTPPAARAVLAERLRALAGEDAAARLTALPAVADFLGRSHQLREVVGFAALLVRHELGQAGDEDVERYSLDTVERQVQQWFEEDQATLHLREKAFLIALAAFDDGPYTLTAELSDLLYGFLLHTDQPDRPPAVPVFGTHMGKRLQLARARLYEEVEEHSEWGPVSQVMAAFEDERAWSVLLRVVWTEHPSARPALIGWLQVLAADGRPLVRTRAASTVAVLAYTDLPSAMALVIEPWAVSENYRHRLVAVSALWFAHSIGVANIPRIIDDWCRRGENARRSWVAIRAQGLIGPERPVETIAALRGAVRAQAEADHPPNPLLLAEIAMAFGLLMLSEAGDLVLAELARTKEDDPAVHALAVGGFLGACERTEKDTEYGRPLVLDWYARAAGDRSEAAAGIAGLWRDALGDRSTTPHAQRVLRRWVLSAGRDAAAEWALAALLPLLVGTSEEYRRLDYLLRTLLADDGTPVAVAARLRTVLPQP